MVGLMASAVFTGPAQGAPSQYSGYQQGQGQQYGSYRASQTGPSAQQQRPYGYEQASFVGALPSVKRGLARVSLTVLRNDRWDWLASSKAGVCSHCGARVALMVLMTRIPPFPEAGREHLLNLRIGKGGMLT